MNDELRKLIEDNEEEKSSLSKIIELMDYYFIHVPKNLYYNIKGGISSLIKRVPYILKQRDWDYGYVLEAELRELEILREGINKYRNHVNWKRDYDHLNTAIKLLNEILDKEGYYFDYNDPNHKKVNLRNARRIIGDIKYNHFVTSGWIDKDELRFKIYMGEVRSTKVWRLYHRFREMYMMEWWD